MNRVRAALVPAFLVLAVVLAGCQGFSQCIARASWTEPTVPDVMRAKGLRPPHGNIEFHAPEDHFPYLSALVGVTLVNRSAFVSAGFVDNSGQAGLKVSPEYGFAREEVAVTVMAFLERLRGKDDVGNQALSDAILQDFDKPSGYTCGPPPCNPQPPTLYSNMTGPYRIAALMGEGAEETELFFSWKWAEDHIGLPANRPPGVRAQGSLQLSHGGTVDFQAIEGKEGDPFYDAPADLRADARVALVTAGYLPPTFEDFGYVRGSCRPWDS